MFALSIWTRFICNNKWETILRQQPQVAREAKVVMPATHDYTLYNKMSFKY